MHVDRLVQEPDDSTMANDVRRGKSLVSGRLIGRSVGGPGDRADRAPINLGGRIYRTSLGTSTAGPPSQSTSGSRRHG